MVILFIIKDEIFNLCNEYHGREKRINIRGYTLLFGVISRKTVQLCSCNDRNLRNHGNARARCIGKIIFQREHYSWQMYFA